MTAVRVLCIILVVGIYFLESSGMVAEDDEYNLGDTCPAFSLDETYWSGFDGTVFRIQHKGDGPASVQDLNSKIVWPADMTGKETGELPSLAITEANKTLARLSPGLLQVSRITYRAMVKEAAWDPDRFKSALGRPLGPCGTVVELNVEVTGSAGRRLKQIVPKDIVLRGTFDVIFLVNTGDPGAAYAEMRAIPRDFQIEFEGFESVFPELKNPVLRKGFEMGARTMSGLIVTLFAQVIAPRWYRIFDPSLYGRF